jgi:iron complex outermembrane receptor protein
MHRRTTIHALAALAAAGLLLPRGAAAGEAPVREEVLEEITIKQGKPPLTATLEVREVRETPAHDLGEALSATPSLEKVRKAGIANDVVLRGVQKDGVAVVIDGAKVHGACPSRMDPPAFHLDYAEVERVEVRRGPFDVSNPGAIGGVVDVRTRRAPPGFGTELNLSGGSSGALDSSATVSWSRGAWDVLAGGAFKTSRPYEAGDGRNATEFIPAAVNGTPNAARYADTSGDQTAYDVRTGFAKLGLAPASNQRLEVSYTRQQADDVLYPYLRMDGIADATDRAAASWRRLGEAGDLLAELRVSGYWSRVEHDMTDALRCSAAATPGTCVGELPRDYSMRTLARSDVLGGKLEAALEGPARLDGKLGADFYVRSWDNTTTRILRAAPGTPYADEASIPDVTIASAGVYAEASRPLPGDVRLTAGLRLDLARTEAAEDRTALYRVYWSDAGLVRTDVLLAGNVQAEWTPLEGLAVFGGWGHGARVPDPQERYFALTGMGGNADWVGQPGLPPARMDEVDLGVRLSRPGLLLQAQAYHAWHADYLALVNRTVPAGAGARSAKTYDDVSARILGYEASLRAALPWRLFLGAGVAYTRGSNETSGGALAEIPPLGGTVSLRWDAGLVFAEVEEAWAADQDRYDAAVRETPTPGWWATNVRVGADWNGAKVFAGVRNLGDRAYSEHLSYARDPFAAGVKVLEPGRTFYLNAQYAFR